MKRSGWLRRVTSCASLGLSLAGCAADAPASLRVGRADTVVVNHIAAVPLPLAAFTARGDSIAPPRARWRQVRGQDLQLTDSGTVTCTAPFDATVEVQVGTLTRQALVRCRPIKGFVFGASLDLRPGDPPREYPMYPIGVDNKPVALIAGEAAILDTSVAVLEGGKVRARRPGLTAIRVLAGNCRETVSVSVRGRVDDPFALVPHTDYIAPVRLVSGEYRSWTVPAGHLLIRLDTDSATHDRLQLGVLRANCARMRPDPQYWSCITGDTTVVVVRRRPNAGAGADTGELVIALAHKPPPRTSLVSRRSSPPASDTLCPAILNWRP